MILNLTQHPATPEQTAAGVVDLPPNERAILQRLLTFEQPPSVQDLMDRAQQICALAIHNSLGGDDGDDPHPEFAMIGGAGYLMPALEQHLREHGIQPVHAFTRREVVERTEPDGAVTKSAVFRHAGFVSTSLTT
jgi:hypothetical protein